MRRNTSSCTAEPKGFAQNSMPARRVVLTALRVHALCGPNTNGPRHDHGLSHRNPPRSILQDPISQNPGPLGSGSHDAGPRDAGSHDAGPLGSGSHNSKAEASALRAPLPAAPAQVIASAQVIAPARAIAFLRAMALWGLLLCAAALGGMTPHTALAAAASIPTPTNTEPTVTTPTVQAPVVHTPTVQAPTIQAPALQPSSGGQRPGWAGNGQPADNGQPSRGREIMGFLFGGQMSEAEAATLQQQGGQPGSQAGQQDSQPGQKSNGHSGTAPATPGQAPTLSPAPVPPPAPVAPTPAVLAPAIPRSPAAEGMQPQSPEAQRRQQQLNQERERQRQERGRQGTPRTPRAKAADAKKDAAPPHTPKTPDAASTPQAPTNGGHEVTGGGKPESSAPPGSPEAQANEAYQKGDYAQARAIWQHLAENGDGQAMNNLGVLFDLGQGVDLDEGRALYWFARSASAGHPSGMSNYGRMLEQGRGIDANPQEAARWFDLAARQGQPEAQYNLGLMYESGHGVQQDHKAAAAWYSRAAAQQQTDALARLGHLYRTGQGVEKNQARATLLLYAAAMRGSIHAMKELEDMAGPSASRPGAVLFGLRLDTATRPAMRDALAKAGMHASRQDDAYICDTYTPGALVPGARQAAFCYGPGRPSPLGFAELEYAVPDKATAQAIVRMVSERFGAPSAGESDDDHLWNLGSVVVATRYEPTRQLMSLMYMIPAVYHLTRQD